MDGYWHTLVKLVSNIFNVEQKKNPFKYARLVADVVKKQQKENNAERTFEDIEEVFQYHCRVCFFRNIDRINTLLEDRIDVLILNSDF